MTEHFFDEGEDRVEWVRPDPEGFTIRTQYKGTDRVLDDAQRIRNSTPKTFRQDGTDFHHVGSIPMEVYEQMQLRLGRPPTAQELVKLIQGRDFNKLKTKDVKL